MVAGSDWQLEALRLHHGAEAAYRISRSGGQLRLEARSAGESCLLQAEKPGPAWHTVVPDFPRYLTVSQLY